MSKNFYRAFLSISFLFSSFVFPIYSQITKADSSRLRTYNVQHYIIRTSFDRNEKTIFGETTVQLKPLMDNFKTVELDAAEMDFESVQMETDNKSLDFKTSGEKIIVSLDKAYSPEDLISIRFKYSAKPKKGVYFVDELREDGRVERPRQIWTQGEAQEIHHWFPSYDFPDDKATTEQFITVAKDEIAVANGEPLETTNNSNGTKTFHFKMPVPHSVYLTSFVVGKYSKVSDSYKNIPLGFYVYPGKEAVARKAFGMTKEMMRIFEELTGVDFPYNKYDQTIVANFQFGGMENITATTMADTEILIAEFDFGKNLTEDLVSHELAHSWFGDLVTCKNWSELWLNEGFATFMEAAYREKMYGRADYLRKIREDAEQYIISETVNKNSHGLFFAAARGDEDLFNQANASIAYQKGGAVIHTLRETVGTENFWKAINIYLNRHKFENVESGDLQRAMEEVSGMDLDWFFRQWVYQAGYPKLSVKQIYSPRKKILNLVISQIQKPSNVIPSIFRLPAEIEIVTAKGRKTEKIEIKNRVENISVKLDAKPSKIILDRENKIPLKAVKYQNLIATK